MSVSKLVFLILFQLAAHPKYRAWMDGFGAGTEHMMLGATEVQRGFGSLGVHRFQQKLNMIDPEIFPLLPLDMPLITDATAADYNKCHTGTAYHLRPNNRLSNTCVPRLDLKAYADETLAVEGLQASLDKMKADHAAAVPISDKQYPKVTFFGTGSCIPNKTRNTSAILVELEPERFMLLDCGEGTYGQICRFYGPERAREVLCRLEIVYISHLHADHHIGLIGLLLGREKALKEANLPASQVQLIAPYQINYWLKTYHYNFEAVRFQFQLTGSATLLFDQSPNLGLYKTLGLHSLVTTVISFA